MKCIGYEADWIRELVDEYLDWWRKYEAEKKLKVGKKLSGKTTSKTRSGKTSTATAASILARSMYMY